MASFAPETIATIGSMPITNTLINTLMVDAFLIGIALTLKNNIKKIPGTLQSIFEMIVKNLHEMTYNIAGKNTSIIFPFFATFFIFILISNWSGLLPGVGSIGFYETTSEAHGESHEEHFVPLIRATTSDLNTTLALALISVAITHFYAIRSTGLSMYLSRYFSFNPILLFVGILEIVSELIKVISLSFRLFGNVFAGEVMLHTIYSLFAFILPVVFTSLEIIVGLVQALVFSMLTMVFMSILMTPHGDSH